jgi:hypothetical protein
MDVTIPARYGNETSNSPSAALFEFPIKLTRTFLGAFLKYFIFDFSMISIYLLTGIPLLLFGLIFGITKWIQYANSASLRQRARSFCRRCLSSSRSKFCFPPSRST